MLGWDHGYLVDNRGQGIITFSSFHNQTHNTLTLPFDVFKIVFFLYLSLTLIFRRNRDCVRSFAILVR